jgi:hypothetical protein
MSKIVITMMKGGKNVKTLPYDNVRSVTITNGGRRYVITPSRINVDNADGSSNVIRINTRGGSRDLDYAYITVLPIDIDYKYIIVWYDEDGGIIAHADVDGRFVNVAIRAWP